MNPPDPKIVELTESNAFVQLLGQMSAGRLITDLAEKFPKVIEAVKKTGKKGKLVLTLVVKPDGKGEVETVDIDDEVKLTLPEKGRKPTTFYIVGDHDLSRSDPGQREIEFPEPAAKPSGVAKAAQQGPR